MRKCIMVCLLPLVIVASSGCGLKFVEKVVKSTLSPEEVVTNREAYDQIDNPAKRLVMVKNLEAQLVQLDDVTVKDIIQSTDIDFQFCVVVEYPSTKGNVIFNIFSKDVRTISKLEKGKSRIRALGDFKRFYVLFNNAYMNVDVTNADISIIE